MAAELKLAQSAAPVRLDLASGQSPREGFTGVDKFAPNAQKVDLFKFPWPWADNSVDEIHCSHFIEHIPMEEVTYADGVTKKDALFAFFDEVYRILKPEGSALIIWPHLKSARAFQDPTHRRFIPFEMLQYLDRNWRLANKLDHYQVNCHFQYSWAWGYDSSLNARVDEVKAKMFRESWDIIIDVHATLKPVK